MPSVKQKLPNICISGVPGTGKSTLVQRLASAVPGLQILDVGAEAEKRDCRESYDKDLQTWIVDHEALVDRLVPEVSDGGFLFDWIHADIWPADVVDLVVTLRTDNTLLYDRYEARGYAKAKIDENIDAEIMNVIHDENKREFDDAETTTLIELRSNSDADMAENESRIKAWIAAWQQNQT